MLLLLQTFMSTCTTYVTFVVDIYEHVYNYVPFVVAFMSTCTTYVPFVVEHL